MSDAAKHTMPDRIWALEKHQPYRISCSVIDHTGQDGAVAYVRADIADEMYEELRTSRCPRPANHRSDEFTVGECVNAGECGCSAGAAVSKAEGRQP